MTTRLTTTVQCISTFKSRELFYFRSQVQNFFNKSFRLFIFSEWKQQQHITAAKKNAQNERIIRVQTSKRRKRERENGNKSTVPYTSRYILYAYCKRIQKYNVKQQKKLFAIYESQPQYTKWTWYLIAYNVRIFRAFFALCSVWSTRSMLGRLLQQAISFYHRTIRVRQREFFFSSCLYRFCWTLTMLWQAGFGVFGINLATMLLGKPIFHSSLHSMIMNFGWVTSLDWTFIYLAWNDYVNKSE